MKKFMTMLLAMSFAVALAGVSFAQDTTGGTSGTAKSATTKKMMEKTTGTIKSIDKDESKITVTEDNGGDLDFNVTKSQMKRLKVGEQVSVGYKTKDDKKIAKRITKVKAK
ncbi:MAG: hypothetical protein ABSG42_07980 [Nitrospirota bacterium]